MVVTAEVEEEKEETQTPPDPTDQNEEALNTNVKQSTCGSEIKGPWNQVTRVATRVAVTLM